MYMFICVCNTEKLEWLATRLMVLYSQFTACTNAQVDMTGIIRYFTLDFNCGFARTAVRELTPRGRWKDESQTSKRTSEFKELFHGCEHFGLQETYFESKPNLSDFDCDCMKILKL